MIRFEVEVKLVCGYINLLTMTSVAHAGKRSRANSNCLNPSVEAASHHQRVSNRFLIMSKECLTRRVG